MFVFKKIKKKKKINKRSEKKNLISYQESYIYATLSRCKGHRVF